MTKCPHCDMQVAACPHCAEPARIHGENMVACTDTVDCCAQVDFGHWCGTENGIPAIHWVIAAWNRRAP
jgi:endogenous inhibitor of DNA gyrase (YacG/DUF329 family)